MLNTFGEFDVPQKQNMSFDWNLLKGVIFGIRTSEYDKKQILDKLIKHKDELCKLCLNGMPVPLLRNCYSIFNGTKYR